MEKQTASEQLRGQISNIRHELAQLQEQQIRVQSQELPLSDEFNSDAYKKLIEFMNDKQKRLKRIKQKRRLVQQKRDKKIQMYNKYVLTEHIEVIKTEAQAEIILLKDRIRDLEEKVNNDKDKDDIIPEASISQKLMRISAIISILISGSVTFFVLWNTSLDLGDAWDKIVKFFAFVSILFLSFKTIVDQIMQFDYMRNNLLKKFYGKGKVVNTTSTSNQQGNIKKDALQVNKSGTSKNLAEKNLENQERSL